MFDERRFKAQLALAGISQKELARTLGINEATLYRKIHRGGDFTREEINRMLKILKIDDPNDIFFAKELAYTQE